MARPKRVTKHWIYTAAEEPWKIERPDILTSEFPTVTLELMPQFHEVANSELSGWPLVRLRYGIHPAIPKDGDANATGQLSLEAIAERFGITVDQVKDNLGSVTFSWDRHFEQTVGEKKKEELPLAQPPPPIVQPKPEELPKPPPTPEERGANPAGKSNVDAALVVLRTYGFSPQIFSVADYDEIQRESEILWMAAKLESIRAVFKEPMSEGIARQALLNELYMRRCDEEMTRIAPTSTRFGVAMQTKETLSKLYQKQWEQLEELCPWIHASQHKITFTGVVSDLVTAVSEFKSKGDSKLLDGLFNAFGIQVEMRMSTQTPDPRYRPGWVAAVNEAKHGLWDPNWKRRIPTAVCKALDDGLREFMAEKVNSAAVKLVDLESSGKAGEYPELVEPVEVDESQLPETVTLDPV